MDTIDNIIAILFENENKDSFISNIIIEELVLETFDLINYNHNEEKIVW